MWEKRGKAYPGALAVFSAALNIETCNYRQKVMTFCFENVRLQSKNKKEAVNQTSKWLPGILWPQEKVSKISLEVDFKCFNEHNWDYKVFAGSREKVNWTNNASKIWFINGVDKPNFHFKHRVLEFFEEFKEFFFFFNYFSGHIPRAVILFGPLVDVLYDKLCEEVPYKFVQCKPGGASFFFVTGK